MDKEGFKVKYFKDTIIGMRAIITRNHESEVFNGLVGTIREGYPNVRRSIQTPRFGIAFDSPVIRELIHYEGLNLNENDEIYLIID